MKNRSWIFWVGMCVQFLVAISPLIPGLNGVWGSTIDPVKVLSINFAVLTLLVPLILQAELRPTREAIEAFAADQTEVRWEKAPAFYRRFTEEIKTATEYVDIAYMAAYPPSETADEERRRYYSELASLIRRRKEVTFRRLVRASDKNRAWITQMLNEMKHARNFQLAIVEDDAAKTDSLVMSVQIVDGKHCWLVALESHEPKGRPRDLYLHGKVVAEALRAYYDRVWERGVILMTAGNLTPDGEAYVPKEGA